MQTPKSILLNLAFLIAACLSSCSAPPKGPQLSPEEIRLLMERQRQARELFEQALSLEGKPEEQKKLYMQAIDLDPSAGKAQNNLGLICLAEKDYPEAVRWLSEAVKRMPGDAAPRFNLGYAYEVVGRLSSAEEQYGMAAKISPDEPDYMESLARVYIRRRDHLSAAEELLKKALAVETRPANVKWIDDQIGFLEKGLVP